MKLHELGLPQNPTDIIAVNVPLFIRLLEWAREDAKTDMQLHVVAENAVRLSRDGSHLRMSDYAQLIPEETDVKQPAEAPAGDAPADSY